jgi:LacI family transcriptional regulator
VFRAVFNSNYFVGDMPGTSGSIVYKFDFIFPQVKTGYFENFVREIEYSDLAFSRLSVKVVAHMVEDLEPEALANKLLEIGKDTDGIAFVAIDHPIIRNAVDKLAQKGVGIVSLVSDISRSNRIAYVGLDNRAAGRTAALLMGRFLENRQSGTIALFPGRANYRSHEERESGFKSLMRERFNRFEIIDMPAPKYDSKASKTSTLALLNKHPELVSIYNTGGATDGIAKALIEAKKDKEVLFIAHELSDLTRTYLINDVIDVIINQDIRQEVFSAVELLVRFKRQERIELSVRQPRLEIYLCENVY